MGFGDVSGAKNGTQKTWLQDAADAGARFVVNCRVERVLVEDGRAAGVEGTYVDAGGRSARVTVRAPTVVVAAGALDTPAGAAAQRHRGPGRRRLPAPASGDRRRRLLRHPAEVLGGGRRSPGCRWRWPTSRTATAT